MSAPPVLEICDLAVEFAGRRGSVRAVDGVGFTLHAGEILALVGESGSGKSVTSLAAMQLLPRPAARTVSGRAMLGEVDLLTLPERAMRAIRGRDLAMIFQDPMSSLNPVIPIGRQISEAMALHQGGDAASLRERAIEMLELVQIPEAARRVDEYPHQLSGGMRQRVMIALALSCGPRVLIADEPTTALDVTIQAQILALLADLRKRLGTAILLITHDLGVVAENADRVVVLYAGRKVEEGPVRAVLDNPLHPYTAGLLASMPRLENEESGSRLREIPGSVPVNAAAMPGCAFAPRCPLADERCRTDRPLLTAAAEGRLAACWKSGEIGDHA